MFIIHSVVGSESVSSVVSRQLLTDLCNHIISLETSITKDVSLYALVKLQPRAISFEEQVI
jgi:COP9 signalosome complex subunit 4